MNSGSKNRAGSGSVFGRARRLSDSPDFNHVFQRGRRSADQNFIVLYTRNEHGFARLGLAIAKRKVPGAVMRNRLKRLARESFRAIASKLDSLDIVVMAQSRAARASGTELYRSLESHWRELQKTN